MASVWSKRAFGGGPISGESLSPAPWWMIASLLDLVTVSNNQDESRSDTHSNDLRG